MGGTVDGDCYVGRHRSWMYKETGFFSKYAGFFPNILDKNPVLFPSGNVFAKRFCKTLPSYNYYSYYSNDFVARINNEIKNDRTILILQQ